MDELSESQDPPPDSKPDIRKGPSTEVASLRLEQLLLQLPKTSEHFANLLRNGFACHIDVLEQLHHQVSLRPIQKMCSNTLATFVPIISAACSTIRIASTIANTLVSYLHTRTSRLTTLRATEIHLFNDEKNSYPMLGWTEEDGTKTLAIFHFEDPNTPEDGSWLMHSGREIVMSERPDWQQSRIDWNVANIEHLKLLFGVAQHMLGLLEWPIADALKLYRHINSNNHSISEMTKHAKIIYNHVLKMNRLDAAFDKISPIIQTLGQDPDRSGPRQRRLGVSLYL